jgi:predicted small integral membrane protein
MTATADFKQVAQYIGLAICTLIMRIVLWVSGILWGIVREIVNGVFRVAIGIIVAILSTIALFGFILWLFTLDTCP